MRQRGLNKLFKLSSDTMRQRGFASEITRIEDLFTVRIEMPNGENIDAPTHLFDGAINIIPYGDSDVVSDAAGNRHRGDEVVSHYFPPGEIGFAIKHHRPFNRRLLVTAKERVDGSTDDIKLQDTHIAIVVGVKRDGQAGVVTVNNPQSYQHGCFGDDHAPGDYPMIFVKPIFPSYVPIDAQRLLIDNIRTMAVAFNTVTVFPPADVANYDGGDPLAASTPESVREHVKMMVQAVAGNAKARKFFQDKAHYVYCAELAFLSASAGVLVPLNRDNILKLGVTEREWQTFKQEVSLHNAHKSDEPSFFVRNNQNKTIRFIDLADLDKLDSLKPVAEYSDSSDVDAGKLAFRPLTMADIVDGFMRLTFPREQLGESIANYQADILEHMKPGLFEMLKIEPSSAEADAVGQICAEIVTVVRKKYANYREFRAALEPLLAEARAVTGGSPSGLFAPPSLFHLVAKGINADDGLMRLQYIGHGLHFTMVKPR